MKRMTIKDRSSKNRKRVIENNYFQLIQSPFFMRSSTHRSVFILAILLTGLISYAQDALPTDYLTKEFHAGRREALRNLMPANSVAVIFSFPARVYSNDVEYVYHQNPDLYYFSGYKEPNSVLFIFKEEQKDSAGNTFKELFFVQKRSAQAEQWTGKRLGVEGVKEQLGISMVYNGDDLKNYNLDLSKFDKVLFEALPLGLEDSKYDKSDLYDLVESVKSKAAMPADISKDKKFDRNLYNQLTASLREIKTPEEMDLLRKAVEISCQGQIEVMKLIKPGMSEPELQGLHEFVHKKYGAESIGYPSIVGSGHNGCVLHYVENNKTNIGTSMVLMDVGAEYHGYTADVTRTIPADGKFSAEEKAIYQLVYDAQEAAFKTLKDGSTWSEAGNAAREVIATGLLKLGIISDKKQVGKYFPHGLGHHIGLDVHDRGSYGKLKKGMVLTIEPGIYIPPNSNCDKKWWNIAVRIEDDALITETGYELLSHFAPRSIADIEKMIAQKSALEDFNLQKLKSGEKTADKKAF